MSDKLVGSHKQHHLLKDAIDTTEATPSKNGKSDWYKITEEQQRMLVEDHGCPEHHIQCPAGSAVYWDSRTQHCGRESLRTRDTDKPNFRCVAYICMLPRSMIQAKPTKSQSVQMAKGTALAKLLVRRKKAFKEHRMTTHWPTQAKLFGKAPQTYGKPLPKVDPFPDPVLTSLGLSLVG